MKIFFILNPSPPNSPIALREACASAARQVGLDPRFGTIDRQQPGSLDGFLDQALADRCERIVVAGGDGSLQRLVRGIATRKCLERLEIGIVPAGTCNDFARWMGLSAKRLRASLDVVCRGVLRSIDLPTMNDAIFLNNAGFGRRPSETPGKRANAWETLRAFAPLPLTITWDKNRIEGNFYMGLACNAPYFSAGLHFSRQPYPGDGKLDLYLVPAKSKWHLATLLFRGRLGRPLSRGGIIALRSSEFSLEFKTDIWPQSDGEPAVKVARHLHFEMSKLKARILFAPQKAL